MSVKRNITSLARIEVQQSFCYDCSVRIKKELQEIEAITDVQLYPLESLVTFNFKRANTLSNALNVLSEIGYPEKGERLFKKQFSNSVCNC